MADKHTQRALDNERSRHLNQIRNCAERIQTNAGYIIARIDVGNEPSGFDLVADAVEITHRLYALQVGKDVTGIYEAELADKAKDRRIAEGRDSHE
jgi:hypothetical protein